METPLKNRVSARGSAQRFARVSRKSRRNVGILRGVQTERLFEGQGTSEGLEWTVGRQDGWLTDSTRVDKLDRDTQAIPLSNFSSLPFFPLPSALLFQPLLKFPAGILLVLGAADRNA